MAVVYGLRMRTSLYVLLAAALSMIGCSGGSGGSTGSSGSSGSTGTSGASGSTGSGLNLQFAALTGSYSGTSTAVTSPSATDTAQSRIDLTLHAPSAPIFMEPQTVASTGIGATAGVDLTTSLVSGQVDIQTNNPADACQPVTLDLTDVGMQFNLKESGDQLTVSLIGFPANLAKCGAATFTLAPPQMPSESTSLSAIEGGTPAALHFAGNATYNQVDNPNITEAITWDFTVTLQVAH